MLALRRQYSKSLQYGKIISSLARYSDLEICCVCGRKRLCSSDTRDSSSADRMRFKWPRDTYMPSSSPYLMFPIISSADDAKNIISSMDNSSKKLLLQELRQLEVDWDHSADSSEKASVTGSQLYQVFVYNSLPFIGFGILDNGIMIVAGEYIDVTIGTAFGISTMAAAALGNLISDVAGVGTAGYIELLVSKLGFEPPDLSVVQSQLKSVRWMVGIGRAIGISIGCLLGMIPLFFFKDKKEKDDEDSTAEKK